MRLWRCLPWMGTPAIVMSLLIPAASGSIAFRLDQPGTDDSTPVAVDVMVSQLSESLHFSVSVNSELTGNVGDLRGLFFHVSDVRMLGGLSAVGSKVTDLLTDPNDVDRVGGGVNIQGVMNGVADFDVGFDVGIAIGTPGMGRDDVRSLAFVVTHEDGPLDLATFFPEPSKEIPFLMAGRLGSVGPPASGRDGSSKILGNRLEPRQQQPDEGTGGEEGPGGNDELPQVPEMSSLAVWSALMFLGVFATRRRAVRRRQYGSLGSL